MDLGNFLQSFLSSNYKNYTPNHTNEFVLVCFCDVLCTALAASLPLFKIFSNHLSISDCRVFEYFLLAKKHTYIRRFRRYYRFFMQTSRMHLRDKIPFSLLNSPKPNALLEGVAFQMIKKY